MAAEGFKRKPKVFIVGISGFLGYRLALHLRKNFCISGVYFHNPVRLPDAQIYPVNLQNLEILESIASVQQPDFTINAMGIVNRSLCTQQPKITETYNVMLAVSFAVMANKIKAKHVHLSCAEVYDGAKGDYEENDTGFAMNDEYGRQKFSAETYIRAQTLESTILRVGRVMGLGSPYRLNTFDTIRAKILKKEAVFASKNTHYSYISMHSFCSAVERVLSEPIPVKHRLFNVGGANLDQFDFLSSYARLLGVDEKLVKVPAEDEKRNYSLNSGFFESSYPGWKAETKRDVIEALLMEQSPGIGIKRWQRTLQTL